MRNKMRNKIQRPEGYPKEDGHRKYWVKYPVKEKDGKWYAADVKEGGYTIPPLVSVPFDSQAECQLACDSNNYYHDYSPQFVNRVITWSMAGAEERQKVKQCAQ